MRKFRLAMSSIAVTGAALLSATMVDVFALTAWIAKPVDGAKHVELTSETSPPAKGGLPDGLVASRGTGDVRAAWYEAPTRRYAHGILGDAVEAGALVVLTENGREQRLTLPDTEVFEDRTPRLADLDGNGSTEVIAIRSSLTKGAAVTVYGLTDGKLTEQASTDFIGRSNRWLNIAGIADFDGRHGLEIAYVRTPHIGGTLFFYTFRDGSLELAGSIDGFSNHAIGSREMRLSAVADVDGDGRMDIAVPSDNRRVLRIVGLKPDGPTVIGTAKLPGRIDKAVAIEGNGPSAQFFVGLDDGSTWRISR